MEYQIVRSRRKTVALQMTAEGLVVHELCHRLEPNHSPRFYARVLRVFSDYPSCEKWLKDNGPVLMGRMRG